MPDWRRFADRLLHELDAFGKNQWRERIDKIFDEVLVNAADNVQRERENVKKKLGASGLVLIILIL